MSESKRALIHCHALHKEYQTPAGSVAALQGVDLQVYAGEYITLLGKSGAGKSTLINMLTGIDRPTRGEVRVEDKEVHQMGENAAARWRGQEIGVVFQFFQLLPMLTCAQNVMLPMDLANLYQNSAVRYARAIELLDQVGIADHGDKLPAAVSGGQRQRVAIARALANNPRLIVADEPTGSLDTRTAESVFAVLEHLVASGTTLVLATHDQELAARAGRTLNLIDGRLD